MYFAILGVFAVSFWYSLWRVLLHIESMVMNSVRAKILIEEHVPLAPLTTMGIGGIARFLARAKTEEQIIDGLEFAEKHGCRVFILGGGSNLVVSDSGFPGLVLKIELSGIQGLEERTGGKVSAAAGEKWDLLVQRCVERNLAGIECLSGIPGTVGATPVQNVGAYGQEMAEVISGIRVLDRGARSIGYLSNSECRFAYRTSTFNLADRDRYVILNVDLILRPNGEPRILYPDLQRFFSKSTHIPSILEVREAVLQIRAAKGMVLQEHDPESRTAGSFFKNPILTPGQAAGVEEKGRSSGVLAASERIPRFSISTGDEKLPAAWLVERAGFNKGFTLGHAGISSKHSLALINRGGASAEEIVNLMHLIQDRIRILFGIDLRPEPVFVGFEQATGF
jgi:UDP-N-acetylmuramate dehydrogenase